MRLLLLSLGCALLVAPAWPPRAAALDARTRLLDVRTFPYLEDDPRGKPRALAEIEARLEERPRGRAELVLRVSAVGPRVEPEPGWEGVRGANRKTAEELASLLEAGELELVTSGGDGTRASAARAGRSGRLPKRSALPSGRLAWRDESSIEMVLEAVLSSQAVGPGTYRSDVIVRGISRLVVDFTWNGGEGRILAVGERAEP